MLLSMYNIHLYKHINVHIYDSIRIICKTNAKENYIIYVYLHATLSYLRSKESTGLHIPYSTLNIIVKDKSFANLFSHNN